MFSPCRLLWRSCEIRCKYLVLTPRVVGNIHANSDYTQRELERLDEDERAVAGGTDEAHQL